MKEFDFYISNQNCKEQAREFLRYTWKESAIVTIFYLLICAVLVLTTTLLSIFVAWWLVFPLALVVFILWSLFNYGYKKYFWNLTQLKEVKRSLLFCGFSKKAGAIIKTNLKMLFLDLFWLILLIFPFFIKQSSYAMATYILWDREDIPASRAIKESQHMMKGNIKRYLKYHLSLIHWYLLILVTGYIAAIWVLPYITTCHAVWYEDLKTDF